MTPTGTRTPITTLNPALNFLELGLKLCVVDPDDSIPTTNGDTMDINVFATVSGQW